MRFAMSGEICCDEDAVILDWFGFPCVSPTKIRTAVESAKADGELILEVNSPGGSALAGMEIRSVLAGADVKTKAIVQSFAASAASYGILGADIVEMELGSQLMLHRPSTVTRGNADAHQQASQMLDSMFESMLDVYCAKCGEKADRETLRSICEGETWLTAERCVELGLADGIHSEQNPMSMVASAATSRPDMALLRERYMEAHKQAEPQASADEDWQRSAAIALERERYTF